MNSKRKKTSATAFSRAAYSYDSAATVQYQVGCRLAKQIKCLTLPPNPVVLEIGCGTGLFSQLAVVEINPSIWIATDISPAMLAYCRKRFSSDTRFLFACMDGEIPAVVDGFDLVCANLVVQWFDDLFGSLERLTRIILPGGWLAFTTLMNGTFSEWVDIHRQLGLVAGTPHYPDYVTLIRQMPQNGYSTIVEDILYQTYTNATTFITTLKAIGAHISERQPLTPRAFRSVLQAFGVERRVCYRIAYGLWHKNTTEDNSLISILAPENRKILGIYSS